MKTYNKRRTKLNSHKTRKQKPKYLEYVHPSIYQKMGEFGMGTYTKHFIPKGTIIIREFPHNVDEVNSDEYRYKLIQHLLKTNRKNFMNLVPHELDYPEDDIYDSEKHMRFFPEISKDVMKLYLLKYKRNAFSFENHPSILFFSTKLNHSCDSNCTYYKDGNKMTMSLKRDVYPSEELFDSYINCNVSKEERQQQLKKRYGFDCRCSRCQSE
jgi:hypothetical protein